MPKNTVDDIWPRIQEAMRHKGWKATQVAVAKRYGITQASISDWSRGRSRPKAKTLDQISLDTGFSAQYLRTGSGDKLTPAARDDDKLQKLLGLWAALSEDSKDALLGNAVYLRTIQITATPERVREVHDDLQKANERFRKETRRSRE